MILPEIENDWLEQNHRIPAEVIPIHRLSYVSNGVGVLEPLFAENPFALYQTVTNETHYISPLVWKLCQQYVAGSSIGELSQHYGLPQARIESFIEDLKLKKILVNEKTELVNKKYPVKNGTAYIQLTEACNLACHGCATAADIIPVNAAQSLKKEEADTFLEAFFRSAVEKAMETVKIKYAGGEPTIGKAFSLIVSSQDTIAALLKKHPSITHVEQIILTNGMALTDKQIQFAKDHKITFAVSLWGVGEIQNLLRRPYGHSDSFTPVVGAIRKLASRGASYNVSTVITPENADTFADLLTLLWDTKSPQFIFRDIPKLVNRPVPLGIGLFRPQTEEQLDIMLHGGYKKIVQGLRKGYQAVLEMLDRDVSLTPWVDLDYFRLDGQRASPCGSGLSYIAVGPTGIRACHEGLNDGKDNNWFAMRDGTINLFDLVRQDYQDPDALLGQNIKFVDPSLKVLANLGVSGCPRLANMQHREFGQVSPATDEVYVPLLQEFFTIAAMTLQAAYNREN